MKTGFLTGCFISVYWSIDNKVSGLTLPITAKAAKAAKDPNIAARVR